MAESSAAIAPGQGREPGRRRAPRKGLLARLRPTPRPRSHRSPTTGAHAVGGARRATTQPAFRRTRGLPGTLAVTLAGALFPGSGFVWTGRRALGLAILCPVALGALWASYHYANLSTVLDLAVDPTRLRWVALLLVVGVLLWAATVYLTYRQARPTSRPRWHTAVGNVFVAVLVLALGAPLFVGARYAMVQADLVDSVFSDNQSPTTPRGISRDDPWAGQDRVNVLLLGGDGGDGREGVRTDSVILMSTDTHTGDTVMFSLPRNMMLAQFPEDSPLHDVYPTGFTGAGDPASYMLNAVYGQVPALHPHILGKSDNEGADAVKQAVEGTLGIPVDYYVLVNLEGFRDVVNAIGGVTVNINEPVAIKGSTDRGVPPVAWLQPGPDQHLDGYHALWFARGRYGSDDYERMNRQRCMIDALIDASDPVTLIRNYQDLAEVGKQIVVTDLPQEVLPAFSQLAWKVKDAKVKSVVFEASDRFNSASPDFTWMRDVVQRNLSDEPGAHQRKVGAEGRAKDTKASCAYRPVS
ncbi:LCP family protein [Nocardioides taihuensis]|uniref:LCP family protein n=1 Tax=Nocardioides taihuensis TaxID=1835606 RepID=A0ABW0BMQ5_9ACTN